MQLLVPLLDEVALDSGSMALFDVVPPHDIEDAVSDCIAVRIFGLFGYNSRTQLSLTFQFQRTTISLEMEIILGMPRIVVVVAPQR